MDDENFELVPKEELAKLRKENNKLAKRVDMHESSKVDTKFLAELVSAIQLEGKRERDLMIKLIGEVKDLNKSTLNNVISKTERIEIRLEEMVEALTDLTDALAKSTGVGKVKKGHEGNKSPIEKDLDHLKKMVEKIPTEKVENSGSLALDMVSDKLSEVALALGELKEFLAADIEESQPQMQEPMPQGQPNNPPVNDHDKMTPGGEVFPKPPVNHQ